VTSQCHVNLQMRMSRVVVDDVIHGFHICKAIWEPVKGEVLGTARETGNDPLAVAVVKSLHGERRIVRHLPWRISSLCSAFLRNGGIIDCTITGRHRYSEDLSQEGLDVTCSLESSVDDEVVCRKLALLKLGQNILIHMPSLILILFQVLLCSKHLAR